MNACHVNVGDKSKTNGIKLPKKYEMIMIYFFLSILEVVMTVIV
jgi:hypothetical protein